MAEGKVRHLFPGGNTPQGFFSYYSYIIPIDATRIFVLKGGPGTGKSTFMRKMGEAFAKRGYDVEFHHCSSDNNSLDGVVITKLGVAFIDGTAPHVVDPKNPGCVDEILNLGEYWNEQGIVNHKNEIIACNTEISKNYQRAYRYLRAAKSVYDDLSAINADALDLKKANQVANELVLQIFDGIQRSGAGKIRKLFASAITPDGPVNYLESAVWSASRRYVVQGDPGTGKRTIVQKVINTAAAKGLDIEVFYCPLEPEKPEHVVIPELDVALTTSNMPHLYRAPSDGVVATINMNDYLDAGLIAKYEETAAYNQQMFWELWSKTIMWINKSKQLHDQLETYYVPYMNFQGVQNLWEKTYNRVLAYTK